MTTTRPSAPPPSPPRPLFHRVIHLTRALHTYLGMFALLLLLFFSLTGLILNHEEWFDHAYNHRTTTAATIPQSILESRDKLALVEYLRAQHGLAGAVEPFDLQDSPLRLSFRSPRVQTDVEIAASGSATITTETASLTALLSNLHRAKNAPMAWRLLLDATGLLLAFASLSGLVLWWALHKRRRLGVLALVVSAAMIAGLLALSLR